MSTDTIYSRLARAQMTMKAPDKLASNPHLKSKYAPLDSVLLAVRPALNAEGLALTQHTRIEASHMVCITRITAPNGEAVETEYPVCQIGTNHQQMGAALTYARRYSVLALCGVHPADEDADGEAAAPTGNLDKKAKLRSLDAPQRKSSAQAKRDGDDERIKTMINNATSLDELETVWRAIEVDLQELPLAWEDGIRDMYAARQEALMARMNGQH